MWVFIILSFASNNKSIVVNALHYFLANKVTKRTIEGEEENGDEDDVANVLIEFFPPLPALALPFIHNSRA